MRTIPIHTRVKELSTEELIGIIKTSGDWQIDDYKEHFYWRIKHWLVHQNDVDLLLMYTLNCLNKGDKILYIYEKKFGKNKNEEFSLPVILGAVQLVCWTKLYKQLFHQTEVVPTKEFFISEANCQDIELPVRQTFLLYRLLARRINTFEDAFKFFTKTVELGILDLQEHWYNPVITNMKEYHIDPNIIHDIEKEDYSIRKINLSVSKINDVKKGKIKDISKFEEKLIPQEFIAETIINCDSILKSTDIF